MSLSNRQYWGVCTFFCFLFFVFYLIATRYGNLSTNDSVQYLAVAANVAKGKGFYDANGQMLVYWPPLYPLLLSLGIAYVQGYIFSLHLCSLLGSLVIWFFLARQLFTQTGFQLLYVAHLSLATPLLMIATFIWSEAAFLLLFSIYLCLILQFLQTASYRWLWMAILPGFLLLLQRNTGFFLLAGVIVALLVCYTHNWKSVTSLIIHFLLVTSGAAYWSVSQVGMNQQADIIEELFPEISPFRNLQLVLGELAGNLLPPILIFPVGSLLVAAIVLLACYAIGRNSRPSMRFVLIVFLIYLSFWLVIPASKDDISRFLSVVLPLFYLIVVASSEAVSPFLQFFPGRVWWIIGVGSLLYPFIRLVHNALHWGNIAASF